MAQFNRPHNRAHTPNAVDSLGDGSKNELSTFKGSYQNPAYENSEIAQYEDPYRLAETVLSSTGPRRKRNELHEPTELNKSDEQENYNDAYLVGNSRSRRLALFSFVISVVSLSSIVLVVVAIILGKVGPSCSCNKDTEQGDQGPQGPQGPSVPDGMQGDAGGQGDKGDPGKNGTAGVDGQKGDLGPKGDKGSVGSVGSPGPQGPVGPRGPQGAGNFSQCEYKEHIETAAAVNFASKTSSFKEPNGKKILGVACSTNRAAEYNLDIKKDPSTGKYVYTCTCKGLSDLFKDIHNPNLPVECIIHYWQCPLTT